MNGGYTRSLSSSERGGRSGVTLSRQFNNQITQAASLQELIHVAVVNFGRMNAVNYCTAYHRIARHMQDERVPPEAWPVQQQHQLGDLLTELNQALINKLGDVQAHNLGLTLWSISKTHRVPQQHCEELWAALQAEVVRRLATVSQAQYMTDKHYHFGPQSLSNIIYSAASMAVKPDYDLLHAMSRAVVWQVEEFKPQGLANILWGLGKLGVRVTHEIRQMVDALCHEVHAQLTHSRHKGSFAPQNLSNTLHGLVNIGITPAPELLSALVQAAEGMLRSFGPQELTNLVWSLSQMHRNGVVFTLDVEALLTRIPDELGLLFADRAWRARVKPQTISNLSLAYAHLGRKPQLLMTLLMKETAALLPQFKPQELSNLLWSMASMEFWHGAGAVDAITKAVGAVMDRLKPQELANTCWAWATMRYFPGAQLLDALLAHAESQLDRFKSQEIGMLSWALARLAYMPAATLVRAALPLVAEWRNPAVQDCGNLLWACTVLGILTPEAMALLSSKLVSLPREQFTQETYIQLYQAKMTLSQHVHAVAQYIPSELLARGETEWRQQASVLKVSVTHRDVASVMSALRIDHEIERRIEDGLMSVDIALKNELVAVEVDGSAHFTQNEPFVPLGRTLWRWRLLSSRGWRVVSVPYFRWGLLRSLDEKKRYLYQLLQCRSVWECYSLDPLNPDAPPTPPANMAHLSPEEVFQYAEQGVPCSSLLTAGERSSTPAASPATPLVAGLGPALGGSASLAGSSGFTRGSAGGLHLASASAGSSNVSGSAGFVPNSSMPMPLSLTGAGLGLVQRPASPAVNPVMASGLPQPGTAAASGNGYHQLPDSLYANDSVAFGIGSKGGSGLNASARPFTFKGSSSGRADGGDSAGSLSRTSSSLYSPSAGPLAATQPHAASAGTTPASLGLLPGLAGSADGGSSLGSSTTTSPGLPLSSSLYSAMTPQHSPQPPQLQMPQLPSLGQGKELVPPRLASPKAVTAAPTVSGGSAPSIQSPAPVLGLEDDSDDDIGDLRSYFGSVIGVSPEQAQQPQGPLSVEEVRRKLALLPAEKGVGEVAGAWLDGWDAAQAAELLDLLDSPTTAARAVQLFDWLQSLPPDSPYAHLCTPATYTTMIVLYGRWRKPKQAVRLFAELKERGEDAPEVHSALLEAFCRSGQYEVARDAYRNMQSQGLAPTPAALRALLDLHMQRGSWEEADALLADYCSEQDSAEPEIFDTVIEHACAADNSAAAQSAYGHMCSAGVAPSPRTFTALLPTLRRQHAAAEVSELAAGLAGQAIDATAAMQALQEACRSNGWFDVSLQLLASMEEASGSASVEMINSVLAACVASGAVAEARQAFDKLAQHGLHPTPDSYLHLAQALVGAGEWAAAAQLHQDMLAAGLQPGEELASLAVDALWCSGLAWAQARALQLFNQALSAGWLPPLKASVSHNLLKLDLRARHLGTGMLRMHRWLLDLRASIGNSAAACVLDEAKRVCVVSASQGSRSTATSAGAYGDSHAAAQVASQLKDLLGASMVHHRAPFRITREAGRAQRLESSTFMLKKWLFTESFEAWDRAFTGAAVLAGGDPAAEGVVPLQAQLPAETWVEAECSQTYAVVRDYEAAHTPGAAALRSAGLTDGRRDLAAAAQQLVLGLGLSGTAQVWHSAVVLLDRCTASGYQSRLDACLAAACVALAAEREGLALDLRQLAALLDQEATLRVLGMEPEQALQEEVQLAAAAMKGDTACLSAVHCWKIYADRLGCDVESAEQSEALLGDSFSRLHQLAFEPHYTAYPPSILAAAALYLGRRQRGVLPFWPGVLQQLTGYHEELHPELSSALRELQQTSQYGSTISQAVIS